jgi:hypothetical protein
MTWTAVSMCEGNFVIPAGLKKIVVASWAIAAPPAYALPMPLTPCSMSANPDARAVPADSIIEKK